jgi:hypothetical protein
MSNNNFLKDVADSMYNGKKQPKGRWKMKLSMTGKAWKEPAFVSKRRK